MPGRKGRIFNFKISNKWIRHTGKFCICIQFICKTIGENYFFENKYQFWYAECVKEIQSGYLLLEELGLNVGIKNFWYTNTILL